MLEDIISVDAIIDFLEQDLGEPYAFMIGDGRSIPADSFKWHNEGYWGRVYVRRGEPKQMMENDALYAVPMEYYEKMQIH